MQRIRPVIGGELHRLAVEHKARIGNAVGVTSDGRAEKSPLGEIVREFVIAEQDIVANPLRVGDDQRLQACAKGDDAGLETVGAAQHHAFDRAAIGQCAEQILCKSRRGGIHAQSSKASRCDACRRKARAVGQRKEIPSWRKAIEERKLKTE